MTRHPRKTTAITTRKLFLTFLAGVLLLTSVAGAGGCAKDDGPLPETNVAPPDLAPQKEPRDSGKPITFTVNRTISSSMVVQRNAYFHVFGTADVKGGIIYGEFMGERRYGKVKRDGTWEITFSSHEAVKESQTLKIYPKNGETKEFTDILVGDVWVISGQSNAEIAYWFARVKKPAYDKQIKEDDLIRIFKQAAADVQGAVSEGKADVTAPRTDTFNETVCWERTTPETVWQFSALGYYFGKELSKLTDVPLGLVMCAAGGAAIRELMPGDVAKKLGHTTGAMVPVSGYYNTLIHPFTRNRITGMVFYQGESESGADMYLTYAENLRATVEAYRKAWGIAFPFINVQLSSYGYDGLMNWGQAPMIRAAQYDAVKLIPNSYIVSSIDQGYQDGDEQWAHPYYKYELGFRAARIAGFVSYGVGDAEHSLTPEPDKVVWNDDNSVTITFKNAGDGLRFSTGDGFLGLMCYYDYGGKIKGRVEQVDAFTLRVIPDKEAAYVGYGLMHEALTDVANITSSDGIPLVAFKIVNENYSGY